MKENAMTYKAEATGGREREIAERLKRITPGTWLYNSYNLVATIDYQDDNDEVCWVPVSAGDTATKQGGYNAEFIANAPDDIRYLLAELTRVSRDAEGFQNANIALRLALERVSAERDALRASVVRLIDEREAAESELERLKQALSDLIAAAEKVRHWHDTMFNAATGETEGMVVSTKAVFDLWAERDKAKSALASSPLAPQPRAAQEQK
jgi:hypothetical protein